MSLISSDRLNDIMRVQWTVTVSNSIYARPCLFSGVNLVLNIGRGSWIRSRKISDFVRQNFRFLKKNPIFQAKNSDYLFLLAVNSKLSFFPKKFQFVSFTPTLFAVFSLFL